jgi:hypothetical protein
VSGAGKGAGVAVSVVAFVDQVHVAAACGAHAVMDVAVSALHHFSTVLGF